MSETPNDNFHAALEASLAWWAQMGVAVPPVPSVKTKPAHMRRQQTATAQQLPRTDTGTQPAHLQPKPVASLNPAPSGKDRVQTAKAAAASASTLAALAAAIAEFDAGVLSDHARGAVIARGNPAAEIMVIGEAPGRQEDEAGQPFVGEAGQLLDKMLAAIGLSEADTYITNICNWRPPGNRNPSGEEIAFCQPFIRRHIELIAPKMIIIVGGVSLEALTGIRGIMRAHGQWQEISSKDTPIVAMPIYHPAFLLRRPELKKDAWRDLLAVKEKLNTPTTA